MTFTNAKKEGSISPKIQNTDEQKRKSTEGSAVVFCDPCAQTGRLSAELLMRSVSPQSPLLAGELPPLAPSAYAPSPRKEGEEEEESTGGKTPNHTQPHSNAMRGEDRGFTEEERSVTGGERWRNTTVGKNSMAME